MKLSKKQNQKNKGFNTLEILFVIGIMAILFFIAVSAFSNMKDKEVLRVETERTIAILEEAKSQTVSALNGSSYGVHFESDSMTLFEGTTYSVSDPDNDISTLNDDVVISDISITGGGSDVIFNKITNDTDTDGSITFSLVNDSGKTELVTILSSGIFYIGN